MTAEETTIAIVTDRQPCSAPGSIQTTEIDRYLDLYKAAKGGNWNGAKTIFNSDKNSLTAITDESSGRTALHVAIENKRWEFVEKLVKKMPSDGLAIVDSQGRNALHLTAAAGPVGIARKMVEKNPNLPQQQDNQGLTPILFCIRKGDPQRHRDMVRFLAYVTKLEVHSLVDEGSDELILAIVASGLYDVALDLINKYPSMALAMDGNKKTILDVIARDPYSLEKGSKIIYFKHLFSGGPSTEKGQKKLVVGKTCEAILGLDNIERRKEYDTSLCAATHLGAKNGLGELVQQILKYFPDLLWHEHDHRLLIHVAIEHRRNDIFSFLVELAGEQLYEYGSTLNLKNEEGKETGDNILHLAARLPSSQCLYSVSGTALQMQRELQWFKEVEKVVHLKNKWDTNQDGYTPYQLFIKEHKELQEAGEKWLKKTAQGCMVVAALVATIVFQAIITVPGGDNPTNKGQPYLITSATLGVFIVANGLAAITSITSLLLFLSIVTFQYAVEDFLKSVPLMLMGALSSLFMALITMTIAFAAAFQLLIDNQEYDYIQRYMYVAIGLGSAPVLLFLRIHLRLFRQVLKSTWGRGVFELPPSEHGHRKNWWNINKLWKRVRKQHHMV